MDAWFALVVRHLRDAIRAPGTPVRVAFVVSGLAAATLVSRGGMGGSARGLAAGLGALAIVLAWQAASSANALPDDRDGGRRIWIGTLAPAPFAHRLAAASAGVLRVAVAAFGGGLVVATALAFGGGIPRLDADVRGTLEAPPFVRAVRDDAPAAPFVARLAPTDAPRRLHLDVRPVMLTADRLPDTIDVDVRDDASNVQSTRRIATRGVFALEVPPGSSALTVISRSRDVHLRIVSSRLLAPSSGTPFAHVLLLAAWLGLGVAAVVPWATFIARFTSGATAAGFAACLVLVGVVGRALFALVADTGAATWALAILGGVVALAPEPGVVDAASSLLEGRMPETIGAGVASSALHFVLGLVLVALPGGEARSDA